MKTTLIILILISSHAFAKKDNTSTSGGRYQIIQLSDMRRDQYLIDTQTGKTWTKICSVFDGDDCLMGAWSPDDTIGINISGADYYKKVDAFEKFLKEKKEKQKAGN